MIRDDVKIKEVIMKVYLGEIKFLCMLEVDGYDKEGWINLVMDSIGKLVNVGFESCRKHELYGKVCYNFPSLSFVLKMEDFSDDVMEVIYKNKEVMEEYLKIMSGHVVHWVIREEGIC